MANYNSTQDLKIDVLRRCGELTDGTSEYDKDVITYLNRAQQGMLSGATDLDLNIGEPFPWAVNQYNSVLTIPTMIQDFATSATFMSNTITFASAPPNNLQGWLIQFEGQTEVYRIASHVGTATTALLDGPFVQPSGAGAANIFLIDFNLGNNILRLCNPMLTFYTEVILYNRDPGQIVQVDPAEFARQFPVFLLRQATPTCFAQTYKGPDMSLTVRFNAAPLIAPVRVEYNYVPVPIDLIDDPNSIPVVPRDHRIALAYYAAYYLCLDKNDSRAAEYRTLATSAIMACVRAYKHEKVTNNPDFGRQIPRPDKAYDYRRLWNWWWY